MRTIEIQTLPQVQFAHAYHADAYQIAFPVGNDRIEVAFISEGAVTIECNEETHIAKKGDIICLLHSPYQIKIHASHYHKHHTVQACLRWIEQNSPHGLYLPLVTPAHFHTEAVRLMIEQLVCNQLLFKDSVTKGATAFLDLLNEVDRCNRNAQKEALPSEVLYTNRAKEYVQNHLHLPITQKSVAKHLSISPEYLCAVFKKTEGIPFIKYVNTEKLSAIRNLMEKEHIYLYEAAALLGYNDPNYVSRLFKKYYQQSITELQHRQPTIAE